MNKEASIRTLPGWAFHRLSACTGLGACRCENGLWFNHVLEWWEAAKADPEHVMFITYEGMLQQPEEHITKIADFLGIEHTPEIVAKVNAAI